MSWRYWGEGKGGGNWDLGGLASYILLNAPALPVHLETFEEINPSVFQLGR